MSQSNNFSITVPAGVYWLGDPCYAVPCEDWMTLLHSCDYFNKPEGEVRGHKVYASGTAYGDGRYTDQNGNSYGVDAGLIGLVPVDYVVHEDIDRLMHKVVVTAPTTFGYNDGVIFLTGYVTINTGYDEDDEDE